MVVTAEQAPARPLPRLAPPRVGAFPSLRLGARTLPLVLGAGYALIAAALVLVELAQPPMGHGFEGIRFSNAVRSKGTREIVATFRDHLGWLPWSFADDPLAPTAYVRALTLAFVAMIALQLAAIVAVRRSGATSPALWALGPVIASAIFLLYPPTSTDIYAYASFGWVAEQGANPYVTTPSSLRGDPYAAFNDWTHIKTPYGPIWTGISRGVVHVADGDPFATAIGFKIVATLAALGLAWLTYVLARRYSGDPRLATTAFVVVAWSPILLVESAATVHLDAAMMLLALLGLIAATGHRFRSHRLGIALLAASALVKPVTLPLIAIAIMARLVTRDPFRETLRRMAVDAALALGIMGAAFAPFVALGLPRAMGDNLYQLYFHKPLRSNPLWLWAATKIGNWTGVHEEFGDRGTLAVRWITISLGVAVVALLTWSILRQRRRMDGDIDPAVWLLRFSVWAWAGVLLVFSVLPVNAHPWYVIWPMAPLALLWVSNGRMARARPPVWLLGLQAWVLVSFVVYHTVPR